MSIETSVARVAGQIQNQTDLIAQIKTALADKAAGGGASGIYMAKVTPAEDINTMRINHNLGTTDLLFALIWVESLGGYVPTTNQTVGHIWLKTEIPTRVTSSYNRENFESCVYYNYTDGNISSVGLKNSDSYVRNPTESDTFEIKAGTSTSGKFYGGVTYTVIIMAASAFKETEV